MTNAKSSDFVSAIVILESPIDIRALDDKLHVEKASKAKRHADVLAALHYNAESTQSKMRAEFDQAVTDGVMKGYTPYWIENLFVIYATKDFIESLRTRGDITFVTENFKAELIEPIHATGNVATVDHSGRNPLDSRTVATGIQQVGALRVNEELGITGNGVIIGDCDTGTDGTHPALAARWRGNLAPWWQCWRDKLNHTQFPTDGNGWGTHTMGTMCGRGVVGTDTTWVGCAPNARWISSNVFSMNIGTPFNNEMIASYQWFTDPDTVTHSPTAVPDVINNSWGVYTGIGYVQCYDYWNTVMLNCEAGGTVVCFAAGNENINGLRSPAIYSINSWQFFAVGAVDAMNFPTPPFPIASWSSRGPTPCLPANPNNIKPEISAPGQNIYSSVPGGGYSNIYSGTSSATAHVSGIVALMREACPDCDPQTIKEVLAANAIRTGYVTPPAIENNTFGNGFIDGYAAVLAVTNLGHVVGLVTDASSNPIVGATVSNANGVQSVQTNATGNFDLPLSAGTYTIRFAKFGYVSQDILGVVVVTGQNTTRNATLQLAPTGTVSGTVTSCNGGPAVGATVAILNTTFPNATTNGSGFYSIANVTQGTYDMQASGAGCLPQTVPGVVIGANTTQNFTLQVDPQFTCSNPDPDNYIACENGDQGGPTFAWFEVSPTVGGPGTLVSGLGLNPYVGPFTLPFTFRFYDRNFTQFYIGVNGYITFDAGQTWGSSQPMPYAPFGHAICMFWTPLFASVSCDVSMYYLASQNALIIEYRNISPWGVYVPETFQVWLYNVATNPGPNGNSQLKIQYQLVSNAGCGVGIQDSTRAYQHLFNNIYDSHAQPLVSGRAICFGGCTPVTSTLTGTITNCTGGPAANATVSFPGSFYPSVQTNGSGVYTNSMVAGTYNVRADKVGCSYIRQDNNVVVNNQTTTVNLTLRAPGTLSGTVTSCTGGPANGATVTLLNSGIAPVTTNGSGLYQITSIPEGTWTEVTAFVGCWPDTGSATVTAGNTTTRNITLISNPALLCSPADGYGYIACEDVDPSGPAYNWRAISPMESGPGTIVTGLTDDNFVGPFTAPFTMMVYGTNYTSYYIGSNGYMTFNAGYSGIPGMCIPQSGYPIGYYPFGCDMYPPGGGQVATYFDTANHLFVLEFYQTNHCCGSTTPETFEVIVYDPVYYPTRLGDYDVVYQYNSLNMPRSPYMCGLQNGTIGLNYECGTTLPTTTVGLANGRAVRFSTGAGCTGSPNLVLTPTSITKAVPLNGTASDSVHICNTGVCPLNWSIAYHQITPPTLAVMDVQPTASPNTPKDFAEGRMIQVLAPDKTHVVDTGHGRNQLDNQGGPDIFGYRWKDSNEPAGPGVPTFNWMEINTIGTNSGLHQDDGGVSLTLPWQFTYYGTAYSTLWVCSNGFLQMGVGGYTNYLNAAIPNTTGPLNGVLPFWEDLNNTTVGNIWYYNDTANNRFVIEYDHVGYYSGTGTATFEVLLYSDGHIIFQYLDMNGVTNSCTVGQQNATGTDGPQVVYNAAYIVNNLAIQFQAAPPVPVWCSIVPPSSGTVQANACTWVYVNFNSAGLTAGQYTGTLTLTNNDQAHNPATVPLTFIVGQLNPPTQLAAFYDPSVNHVSLYWAATGAPQYRVYSSTTAEGPYNTLVGSSNTNSLATPYSGTSRLFFVVVSWDGSAAESAPSQPAQLGER